MTHKFLVERKPVIFIRINKTAGTSIRHALGLAREHKTAQEKKNEVGVECWQSSFVFSVVRNPWDRIVSLYHHRINTNQTELAVKPIKFSEWVRYVFAENDPKYYDKPKMLMPQLDWLTDTEGREIIDFIARFETLEQDFRTICGQINDNVQLAHMKRSKRKNYQYYYDAQSVDIIDHWFKKDITRFNYKF